MSRQECLNADWRTVGFEDGAAGHKADYLSNHRKACSKAGVSPDLNDYTIGRDEGLVKFCSSARGFQVGRAGETYEGVCDPSSEQAFLIGYHDGLGIGNLERNVIQTRTNISSDRAKLKKFKKKIKEANIDGLLEDSDLSREEREKILDSVRKWEKESGAAEVRIRQRESELIELNIELGVLKSNSQFL